MVDFPPLLPSAAAAIGVAVILPLLWRSVRPDAVSTDGKSVVSYGRPIKAMVGICWIGWLGFLIAAIFTPAPDRLMAGEVTVGVLLLIVAMHLEFFGVRIAFDSGGIQARSPWRPKREIPWSAITRVRFSPSLQWYVVQTKGYGSIRLHTFLSGIDSLLDELESRGIPVVRPFGT